MLEVRSFLGNMMMTTVKSEVYVSEWVRPEFSG